MIEDGRGRLLLELRPPWAARAAGQLTCFGGACEHGEDAEAALRRELAEELGWRAGELAPCCDLHHRDGRWLARFFRGRWTGGAPRCEPGVVALWAPWASLPGLPLSPWHRAALAAVAAGRAEARV